MKLRDAINSLADWLRALEVAHVNHEIDFMRYLTGVHQIREHVRAWIGEDLLEREL